MTQYDFKPRFKKYFPPSHVDEAATGYLLRDISRVYFEFLRNLLVVGAIKIIAIETASALVDTIYGISLIMLVWFFFSFIIQFDLKVTGHFIARPFGSVLDFFLSLAFAFACTAAGWWLIEFVVGQIAGVKGGSI